jgi:hypothetical protein
MTNFKRNNDENTDLKLNRLSKLIYYKIINYSTKAEMNPVFKM